VGRDGCNTPAIIERSFPREQFLYIFNSALQKRVNDKHTRTVIPNAHISVAIDCSPLSNISGAIQSAVPPSGAEPEMENEEFLNSEKPKS